MDPIEGAILAAGRGERLRVDGPDLPKPLVRLDGETLLIRQARTLLEAGSNRVIAAVNSETAAILKRDATPLPPPLTLVVRDTPNSMETLFEIGEHVSADRVLAATVDAILGPGEMRRFAHRALELGGKADAVLGVVRWRGDERPLFVETGNDGAIRKIGAGSGTMVTAGVYFLPRTLFGLRQRARKAGLSALRQFLAAIVEWGVRVHAVELTEVIDIDVAADLEAARAMLARGGNR